MILYLPGHIFSPVPLHRDYLLRLCARDGIASSIIIIIRRFASSLFAGCGWLWWVVALTHALHRPSSTPSCGRFWGFWDEFGAPPFFSSFCHYRCLSSFFARQLSSSLRGRSLRRFVSYTLVLVVLGVVTGYRCKLLRSGALSEVRSLWFGCGLGSLFSSVVHLRPGSDGSHQSVSV